MLGQFKKEVGEIRKLKDEMEKTAKEFLKTMSEGGRGNSQPSVPADLNSNLKHISEISKNQLEGL